MARPADLVVASQTTRPREAEDLLRYVADKEITRIDLKVGDLTGRLRHVSVPVRRLEAALNEGIGFAGSHYGFSGPIGEDMIMVPDPATAWLDPFSQVRTLSFLARPVKAGTDERFPRDPRAVAEKAEQSLKASGVATRSRWLPELEFYLLPASSREDLPPGDTQVPLGDGYHASPPRDRFSGFRASAVDLLEEAGIPVKYDHHETGAEGQMEVELEFADLVRAADSVLLTKYIIRNLASRDGYDAVFLPKPMADASGNGLHVHVQIWNKDQPTLSGDGYAGLSQVALSFIAGILDHIRSLAAFTNPSTNSYRRLVPGFEAPIKVGFGVADRTAAVRIPGYAVDPSQRQFEYRPLDATANPYLAFAALLMAGLDGVRRELVPTDMGFGPLEDGVTTPAHSVFPRTLAEALEALEADNDYLRMDDVFPEVLLEEWIQLKREEYMKLELEPHPTEFRMYGDI